MNTISVAMASRWVLLATLALAGAGRAVAQAPGTGGPTPQAPDAPTAVPLDGGTSLLLAGGLAYGLRRLRRRAAASERPSQPLR
ncbi:PID-CTERM protein-sorting domain-containing protein [Hymenobacter sp. BRD128]|uniref:PID-CTERM protein-sorting domain-containing protein n=1 Tax=Hymenobacter sp. BRD128 TaxID=2675878 RepID=UPI0020B6723B|nr:hypothetical protein [Hymenobacter sp. BRD128]